MREPIFIIGSPRSGTTLLRMMLDAHPNISCGPETFFLIDMKKIVTEYWDILKGFGFDREYWVQRLAAFFSQFQEEYARRRGKNRWAEKTPIYTLHLEFIEELFPDAKYLHIVRDPTGVMASHRDRWGWLAAVKSARVWPHYIRNARELGEKVGSGRYKEITYESLVGNPEAEAREMFNFLGEDWNPIVLQYDKAKHDVAGRFAEHAENRRKEGGTSATIYSSRALKGGADLDIVLRVLARRALRKSGEQ